MSSVAQLLENCRSRLRKTRNMLTVLDGEDFARAATIFTVEESVTIETIIDELDVDKLRAMVRTALLKLTPLHRMGIKQLREIASTLRVKNYYNLQKDDLIREIERESEQLKVHRPQETGSGVCVQSCEASGCGGTDNPPDKQ
jgi:hypothetical protein